MPRNFMMSWEGHPNYRWVKMYRGKRHRVSCKELGTPETKEDSYQAANHWWQSQMASLAADDLNEEQRSVIADIEKKLSWAAQHAPSEMPRLRAAITRVKTNHENINELDDSTNQNIEMAKLFGIQVPEDVEPLVAQQFFGDTRLWQDRLGRFEKTAKEKTIKTNLASFLELQRLRLKPASYREIKLYLDQVLEAVLQVDEKKAVQVLPAELDVQNINEDTIRTHHLWLAKQKWENPQKNKYLGFYRRFISWLVENNRLANPPRNLKSKLHRFKVTTKAVKKFENGLVRECLDGLPEDKRLWAILGLNCGMTQADLGALTWDMIDCKKGTLTRKRVKTESQENVPVVTYKLWSQTKDLLCKNGRPTSGLVFATDEGVPMYVGDYKDEEHTKTETSKKDLFSTYWNRMDPKPAISLGKFRSIAASILKTKVEYRPFVQLFLGHAPATIADKHYGAESNAPFFEALTYVQKQIFKK